MAGPELRVGVGVWLLCGGHGGVTLEEHRQNVRHPAHKATRDARTDWTNDRNTMVSMMKDKRSPAKLIVLK